LSPLVSLVASTVCPRRSPSARTGDSVRTELVAEVKFLTWTADNLLRQVVYQGLARTSRRARCGVHRRIRSYSRQQSTDSRAARNSLASQLPGTAKILCPLAARNGTAA
jgi:ATP-dependent DNA ligase